MGKIYVILGKTLSGKTSLINGLKSNKINADFPVSFTSRPPRDGEIDGIGYQFISRHAALYLMLSGKSVANRSYQASFEIAGPYPWYYGLYAKDLLGDIDKIVVTDYEGLLSIQESYDNVISIYLNINRDVQLKRLKIRKDDLKEAERRLDSDDRAFNNKTFDFVVDASKSENIVTKEVVKIIEKN